MGTEPRPAVARVLDTLASVASAALVGLVLWRQFDPDFDPRELVDGLRERLRAEREYRRALRRTLDEIERLPERREEP